MPRFELNKRTFQFEIAPPRRPTASELLTKLKRVHFRIIEDYKLKDDELREMISRVERGTRNVHYLTFKDRPKYDRRLNEIVYFILREFK